VLTITLPYDGHLLVGHLAAYGLAFLLDDAGAEAYVDHDRSLSFEPRVITTASPDELVEVVRRSAEVAERVVEADIEPGRSGNDRRPVIWARASYANDPARARTALTLREELAAEAEREGRRTVTGLLAGLGASAAWGLETEDGIPKPAHGATELDGVLGNHTSDFVRGVLRPARGAAAAATIASTVERWAAPTGSDQADKTGWAPPGTRVDLIDQWLAASGLALLPVAHRPLARSETPACWSSRSARRQGVALPVLSSRASVARLRTILAAPALTDEAGALQALSGASDGGVDPYGPLRRWGVGEVVVFARTYAPGAGSSVAFTFDRGKRVDVA